MNEDLDRVAITTQLAYGRQTVGNSFPTLPGYVIHRVFDDQWDNTGFYAASFLNDERSDIVIAIRGSEDRMDVVTDASLGVSQYQANKSPLIDYIGENILMNRITIAGHSLGGGLSQYLGYEAAMTYTAFRDKLTIHTHNGFGGIIGISKIHGRFEPAVTEGVTFRNYRHPDDPVSRIGGQAGGIFAIRDPDPQPNDLLYAHSNQRFLRNGASVSPFDGAAQGEDDAFDITQTLEKLGPQLSLSLKQLFQNDRPVTAVMRMARLFQMVPKEEQSNFYSLVRDVLPFSRMLQRMSRPVKAPSADLTR
jgi:hypothetical protein